MLKERLMKIAMRFYLNRFLCRKSYEEEYMTLSRVEDIFIGYLPMLGYLVEDLVANKLMKEAKQIMIRHDVREFVRIDVLDKLD